MRISDWSSDVCSSDLHIGADDLREDARLGRAQIGLAGLDTEFRRLDGIAHRAALIDGNRKLAAGADQPRRRGIAVAGLDQILGIIALHPQRRQAEALLNRNILVVRALDRKSVV